MLRTPWRRHGRPTRPLDTHPPVSTLRRMASPAERPSALLAIFGHRQCLICRCMVGARQMERQEWVLFASCPRLYWG